MMRRLAYQTLLEWKDSPIRKPMILRGARQVGKTHLIQQFSRTFDDTVTINFEQQPEACEIFSGNLEPTQLLRDLHLLTSKKIIAGQTLLFLDEIQEIPRALLSLRYFYEKMPTLHVVAAGSLLDFAIEKVGVPVGRVSFLYLRPLSFVEFLMALDKTSIIEALFEHPFPNPMNQSVHEKLLRLVAEYIAIGGMPDVVKTWRDHQDITLCHSVLRAIIESYRFDLEKYCKKHQIPYTSLLFDHIPRFLGEIFRFSKLPGHYRKRELSPCLDLLTKAQLIKSIVHSDGQGLPLGAQTDFDYFKLLFLDLALAQQLLDLNPKEWFLSPSQAFNNKGAIVESFVGQELLAYSEPQEFTQLYFWKKHQKGSSAEIDYLINRDHHVIPIEVKSGAGSSLKSMHQFLQSHPNSPYGIRISTQNYSSFESIHSYPLYAIATITKPWFDLP